MDESGDSAHPPVFLRQIAFEVWRAYIWSDGATSGNQRCARIDRSEARTILYPAFGGRLNGTRRVGRGSLNVRHRWDVEPRRLWT